MSQTLSELAEEGMVETGVVLGSLTTYKLGGPARFYLELKDENALMRIALALGEEPVEVLIIGRGSNLVISDAGWPGLAIRFGTEFSNIEFGADGVVSAGTAVPLPRLARESVKQERGGLEFFVGIPGSVGGAVRMNAGGHGSETAEWLIRARVFDLSAAESREVTAADLDMSYRSSSLTADQLVLSADFRTEPITRAAGEGLLREITQWRRAHQPGGTHNAGSVFRNPPGDAAGRIIDELGLKGFRVGGAAVSKKHANFFEADPGAKAQDVYELVAEVRRRVEDKTGIALQLELQFAGDFE